VHAAYTEQENLRAKIESHGASRAARILFHHLAALFIIKTREHGERDASLFSNIYLLSYNQRR